ncbi:uncharacterized protein LOC120253954 isoform X2 [Dioscorea cayenensis subsp. rotundata]|uniref:Uncharacterized protein LOC120253954 isoform X2 n=1 Tax=Dioscorea cayennensis subsp. rotundata TaxID=55577 RepID=A0AB40ASM0_DIOCR|nr:uncharacterized protein LOC120253954 isoform X2 [Dioscorea cayenensis subsp. rotundata]
MTWHATHERNEGVMQHPSDAEAWKHFDRTYPDFAQETRNIRLGLCADGFAPHGQFGRTYSCWPVVVTPYNLPPGMCMKRPYMFLTLICPGPKNPKKNIDVFLQPLIDELNNLWVCGEMAYDISKSEYFRMKAALLWTINDFPAYGMLSGWSTAGVFGCPICMESSNAFHLQHGRKASYFDCHRKFLPQNHSYRKDKKSFIRGRVEKNGAPPILSGDEILNRVMMFPTAVEDPINTPPGYGADHKWTKRSIFWDLPYWKTNLIRHNLDVMHIEKNVFDNVFFTVMDVKGKSKDNINARKDVGVLCDRKEIAVPSNSTCRSIPKALYTLTKAQKRVICEWIHQLRFPDGYASNLGRCVDMNELKITGMKSHDCHVFMQRLIPIAFRELLPSFIWNPLTELSLLFQCICSVVLDIGKLIDLEEKVAVILCNLEKIFPPAFFDSMEHLVVHLPYEARIGGPVQYRWMYPFERFLQELKKTLKNKAHVEGSICQAYIAQEINIFAEHYFEPHISCRRRRLRRNDEGVSNDIFPPFSIFNYIGRAQGRPKIRWLSENELHVAHTYILRNCPEVQSYYKIFVNYLQGNPADAIDKAIDKHFAKWFESFVANEINQVTDPLLQSLAWGPSKKVTTWPGYFINGYNFHTVTHGMEKATMNSGVCVQGTNADDSSTDFYGLLEDIVQLEYHGSRWNHVVLFECTWFDPINGTKVHPIYKLVDINRKRIYPKYDPFVLAQQAIQVNYIDYPSTKKDKVDWLAVSKTKARRMVEATWPEKDGSAYQMEEIQSLTGVNVMEDILHLFDPQGIQLVVDLSDILQPISEGESEKDELTDDEDNEQSDGG